MTRFLPGSVPAFLALLLAVTAPGPAQALLIQRVGVFSDVVFLVPDPLGNSDGAEVQGTTSTDITTDILATIGDSTADPAVGGVTYQALASAGRFGAVGLRTSLTGGISASETYELTAQVSIYSDEFVNLLGVPARVEASFIIDGGSLLMEAGRAEVSYQLEVEGENLGTAPIESPPRLLIPSLSGPSFRSAGEFVADALGNQVFTTRGADIGATQVDRNNVDIPFSFQTLDLGILGAGERMAIRYFFDMRTTLTGPGAFAEGIFTEFSDPLSLGSQPVIALRATPLASSPLPEPPLAALLVAALAGCAARGRSGRAGRADRARSDPGRPPVRA